MQTPTSKPESNVIPFPSPAFVLELRSERFMDLVRALHSKGFSISNTGKPNRFSIDDVKEQR